MRRTRQRQRHLTLLSALLAAVLGACSKPEPLDLDELRSKDYRSSLSVVRELPDGPAFSAYLVAYRSAGLRVHAMVAVPDQPRPARGFPVIVANHGHVPEPERYGITAEGTDARPGDYYRSLPGLYTERGFIVVLPDYRGHNTSEGIEYTRDKDAPAYYAEDVMVLLHALADIPDADTDNVFMWSHSMGGIVAMRTLLATDAVKGASFWSTMPLDDLFPYFGDLDLPLIIHHALRDRSTPAMNSKRLADALRSADRTHTYHSYPGDDHYFTGDYRRLAADRDAALFRRLIGS